MTNKPIENENENTAGREQVVSENPVDVAEMIAMVAEMQMQMKILQEQVDNGQPFSGPNIGEERPPVNGPRAGDERENNKESARSERQVANADDKMAAPSKMASMIYGKILMSFFLMKMVEKKKRRRTRKVLMR